MFVQFPMKIVNNDIMPNASETKEDDVDREIKSLSKLIVKFKDSKINLEPVTGVSVMNFITLGMSILAFLLIACLIVLFVLKSRRIPVAANVHPEDDS